MYDTIIIGAGIAGMTSAIYASKQRMKFEILSTDFGGQFRTGGEIVNYPGIKKTTGPEMMKKMQEQMDYNNINIKKETAEKIEDKNRYYSVKTDKNSYDTKTLIIATGSLPRKLKAKGEEAFAKKGVTYCAICDGPLFSGMQVAVIGGGNSGMEAADFMKNTASKIYLLTDQDHLQGHKYLVERTLNNPKIEVLYNTAIKEIKGEQMVNGIIYEQEGRQKQLDVKGVIIEIGRKPSTDCVKGFVELDQTNHIKIDCETRTSRPGVFAAGDCTSGKEYQYAIAAGQGAMALIKAARYLANTKTR